MPPLRQKIVWILVPSLAIATVLMWPRPAADDPDAAVANPSPGAFADLLERVPQAPSTAGGEPANFRSALMAAPKEEAMAFIRDFLASGKDRPTGMEFELEKGGRLKSWPTRRTMLLDLAGTIDPEAAAGIARVILAKPTTADEWAIALRNLGRVEENAETDRFLVSRTVELIQNPEWQSAPSVGYLNAFDVLVHLEAAEQAPLLSELVQRKDRVDLAHAAFLTIDRLVQRKPADMLERLSADTALQQSRPEMTAQQFARADLRDEAQREIVKQWLLDPSRNAAELRAFTGVFPNHNRFVSHNLLTAEVQMTGVDLAAHDRATLEILESWGEDPGFEPVREHVAAMTARLEQFTRGTTTGP